MNYHLSSIIYYLSSIIYYLLSIIYHLLSIIYHLLSIIYLVLTLDSNPQLPSSYSRRSPEGHPKVTRRSTENRPLVSRLSTGGDTGPLRAHIILQTYFFNDLLQIYQLFLVYVTKKYYLCSANKCAYDK